MFIITFVFLGFYLTGNFTHPVDCILDKIQSGFGYPDIFWKYDSILTLEQL